MLYTIHFLWYLVLKKGMRLFISKQIIVCKMPCFKSNKTNQDMLL